MTKTRAARVVQLTEVATRDFEVGRPFNAQTTLHKPSHFPSPFEVARHDDYLFVTHVGSTVLGGRAAYGRSHRRVTVTLYAPRRAALDTDTAMNEIGRRLGLTVDVTGYQKVWNGDSILSALPARMCGARPSSPFSLYEFLVICTVLQNTTVGRTVQMARALADELGGQHQFPTGEVLSSFWLPGRLADLGEARLRELKLGYRAKTLVRAAQMFADNPQLETELVNIEDTDRLRERLIGIYGIGPASVGYIMFEWFKALDEFRHVSPWELRILSMLLFDRDDVPAADMVAFCRRRWAPYTMLAVHAVFEAIFWRRSGGDGPAWLDDLIRL